MPFLNYLDPASVKPEDLVVREDSLAWLRKGLDSYLSVSADAPGRAFCILGEKGVGKTLLTRKVLADLRELHSATTLFITADCRRFRSQRAVYGEIARQAVDQLARRSDIDEALLATARILETIAKYDDVERRVIHEHLVQHKAAVQLEGPKALIEFLGASYDISLQRGRQSRETLEGSISFDAPRLREAVIDIDEAAEVLGHSLATRLAPRDWWRMEQLEGAIDVSDLGDDEHLLREALMLPQGASPRWFMHPLLRRLSPFRRTSDTLGSPAVLYVGIDGPRHEPLALHEG